ncbi:hypothetical protein [Stappia sp.]|uniref:hypothetical protein n=1 Tax=Stappia sp. TaxID=1870903 RepID=UPI0032D97AEA
MNVLRLKFLAFIIFLANIYFVQAGYKNENIIDINFDKNGWLSVCLSDRISLEQLEEVTDYILNKRDYSNVKVIRYLIDGCRSNSAWALARMDRQSEGQSEFVLKITGFTKNEWLAFGRDKKLFPDEATVFGYWDFPNQGIFKSELAAYEWNGRKYVYHRFHDGSGTPDEVIFKQQKNRTKILYPDDNTRFWVIGQDKSIELWDSEGPIPGWRAKNKMVAQENVYDLKCEVSRPKIWSDFKFDDFGMRGKKEFIRIDVFISDGFIDDAKSIAKSSAPIIKRMRHFDQVEYYFYVFGSDNWFYYTAHTPKTERLIFRRRNWEPDSIGEDVPRTNKCLKEIEGAISSVLPP